ncbi:helix-turn-helix domain-containing protein [Rhizobium lusitanum]|jgi:transcriptional regulator with XRE-family HTH domain|uniref:helix-turn-helix domain-containing protein n=1 Tax=Rhizobium lusitanum TaxID=293958 RepID=UPI000B809E4E|nr:helix-turn-helix transcriptional regulator [Rhizobium lusitanum]
MTLDEYLRAQEPKISHADFAKRIGVEQAAVSRYVNGKRFPAPEIIRKIHEATNSAVTANDLLKGFEEAQQKRARESAA